MTTNDGPVDVHLFLISTIAGTTVVFLLETEPGVVEFPRLRLSPAAAGDAEALKQAVLGAIGVEVEVGGFVEPPPDTGITAHGRILLARLVSGTPRVSLPHVGWEWTPGTELVRMPFAPPAMVEELKTFMNA